MTPAHLESLTPPQNDPREPDPFAPLIFLLSPAHCGGRRAAIVTRPQAEFDLAVRLRSEEGAPLGEVFAYVSGLYFRGKLAYARAFARPHAGTAGVLVITAGRGLMAADAHIRPELIAEFANVAIDLRNQAYTEPLIRHVESLSASLPSNGQVVLLGSVATAKYVDLLTTYLGSRLLVPAAFVGMGDMARGALMLRAAKQGVPLTYRNVRDGPLSTVVPRPRSLTNGTKPPVVDIE